MGAQNLPREGDLYRLTSVTYPSPSTTSYAFDAFGNRTSMTVAGNTTTYAYDDNDRITSVTPPSPGSWYYYLADSLGSTMAVVDASGVVQDSYTYDVYGTPTRTGKQKRWKNNQKALNDLCGRFEHLDCANHIGTGWVPNDFDEQLCGEYPKFDASSKRWWNKLPDVDLEWPEVPDGIWWNDDDWWNPPIPVPAPGPVPAY